MAGGDFTEHDFPQPPAKRSADFGRGSLALTQSNLNEILAAAAANNGSGIRNPFNSGMALAEEEEDADREEGDDEIYEEDRSTTEMKKLRNAMEPMQSLPNATVISHLASRHLKDLPFAPSDHCPESDKEDDAEDQSMLMPSFFGGLQFKIRQSGISESGEPEIVVSMEINNVAYEGSLFAAATKKNVKLHKLAFRQMPNNNLTSPVKSITSSSGSAVTTQMLSPKNGSLHNENEADVMNNNCVEKNCLLEPEVQIHSPSSPSPAKNLTGGTRMGSHDSQNSSCDGLIMDIDENVSKQENLSHNTKPLSHIVVGSQPMVSS